MRTRITGLLIGMSIGVLGGSHVHGQTFLERLTQQLNERAPAETLPAPRVPAGSATVPSWPVLGLRVAPVNDEAARVHQLPVRRGALITGIEKGSPAERGGLPLGGVIVALDGRRIDSPEDLVQAIRSVRGSRDVDVTYYERDRLTKKKVAVSGAGNEVILPQPPPREAPSGAVEPLIPPPPAPDATRPLPSTSVETPLERQFGAGGNRPLLGRLGRILDGVVAPAQAIEPAPPPQVVNRVESDSEVAALRRQVEELRRQLDVLQRHVDSLERKLNNR
jgi:membrane-associated protease RseP (regulator of RpoE activity)